MPRTAAIIIGNEILTGKFADDNGPYMIRRFRELGADLVRLTVVRDDVTAIADEVRRCAAMADAVITSGGVGPTHDDVTLQGVAAAFGEELRLDEKMLGLLTGFGLPDGEAARRMANVPESAELLWDDALSFPVVCVHGVYVLPGVPKLFRLKFDAIAQRFAGEPVLTARLHTPERETEIAKRLDDIQERFPTVEIGSYPRLGETTYRVIVTLESRDAEALERARAALQAVLDVDG